jgi:drug/metabolite transporter (DMT)-like permease
MLRAAALPSLTAALAWGAMFPIANAALPRIGAVHLTAIRYALAVPIFLAILAVTEGRSAVRYDGRFLRAFALGSLGFAGFNLLAFVGLEHTKPQNAALIIATTPLLTALVLWARTGVRPARATLGFAGFALLGVALVISKGDPMAFVDGGLGGGELLVLLGALSFVRYTMGASEMEGWSPLRYTALTATAGTITIVLAALAAGFTGWEATPSLDDVGSHWLNVAYVLFIGAVVGVLAWNAGVKRLGPQNAALFMNLVPVTTFTIEIARGYTPGVAEVSGAGLTVAALVGANVATRGFNGVASRPWQLLRFAPSRTS